MARGEDWETMADTGDNQITLTMKGARAERGVSLSDFESFIDNFLAALRDYDRAGRGQQTKKSGHPDRRAEAVTAFRLVGFRTGSGVATLEPELVSIDEDEDVLFDEEPISLTNLKALTADLSTERAVPAAVIESLEKACRAAGSDGSLSIGLPGAAAHPLVVNSELLDRVANAGTEPESTEVTTVSGRLHLLDLEPDRLGIRTAGGVEWLCKYPESLEERVKAMLDRIGMGRRHRDTGQPAARDDGDQPDRVRRPRAVCAVHDRADRRAGARVTSGYLRATGPFIAGRD